MLINPAIYSSISSNIVAMRRNTIAIRKTLLRNRKVLDANKRKNQREEEKVTKRDSRKLQSEKEQSKTFDSYIKNIKLPNWRMNLKNPMSGFSVPGLGILGGAVSFFGFGLLGWMLGALPSIIKSVQEFIKKAKAFLKTLDFFWQGIKTFFELIYTGIERFIIKMGFGGANSLGQGDDVKAKKQLNTLTNNLKQFIAEFPKKVTELVKGLIAARNGETPSNPSGPSGPAGPMGTAYGIDIKRLADAVSAAEGNYNSIGKYLPPRFPGDKEVGRGLGRYQFMSYRGDLRRLVKSRGKAQGHSDAYIQKLFEDSEKPGSVGETAAKKMMDILGKEGQDALMKDHTINTLTKIKRAYPQASEEFLVRRFSAAHISGNFNDLTSADINNTTGAMHGEKIWKAYQKLPASSVDPNQPILSPSQLIRPAEELEAPGPLRRQITETIEVPIPPEVLNRVRSMAGPSESYFNSALKMDMFQVDGDNVREGLF